VGEASSLDSAVAAKAAMAKSAHRGSKAAPTKKPFFSPQTNADERRQVKKKMSSALQTLFSVCKLKKISCLRMSASVCG
jgi:hypothetical protein